MYEHPIACVFTALKRTTNKTTSNCNKALRTTHPIYRTGVPLLPRVRFLYI